MNDMMTKESIYIKMSDVDYKGQYQLYELMNRFAEIATLNAKKIGLWHEDMRKQYGWVVVRQSLHLDEPIYFQDVIELSTLVNNGTMVTFPRYYFIEKEGKRIGYCSSLWTLIDTERRRVVAPRRIGLMIPEVHHDVVLEEPQPIVFAKKLQYVMTRQVRYSDTDVNQHMNNARYMQWGLDVIDYHIHEDFFMSDVTIQYKKEMRPLQEVQLYVGQDQQNYMIEGRNEQQDIYFSMMICFTKR